MLDLNRGPLAAEKEYGKLENQRIDEKKLTGALAKGRGIPWSWSMATMMTTGSLTIRPVALPGGSEECQTHCGQQPVNWEMWKGLALFSWITDKRDLHQLMRIRPF